MDLFKELLPLLDRRGYDEITKMTDKEIKKLAPFVVMKFMSASNSRGMEEYHIEAVNEFVNKNFWELSDHPKLQLMLLAACGTGQKQYHYYAGNQKKNTKLFKAIHLIKPDWKEDEILMMIKIHSDDDIMRLFRDYGYQDKELKDFKKELKAFRK